MGRGAITLTRAGNLRRPGRLLLAICPTICPYYRVERVWVCGLLRAIQGHSDDEAVALEAVLTDLNRRQALLAGILTRS